jgi:hypothetical protein
VVVITEEEEWEEALAAVAMSAAGAVGLDQLEPVSVAVASTQPRRSVVRAGPSEWDHAEAELVSACRIISGLSTLMDELPGP